MAEVTVYVCVCGHDHHISYTDRSVSAASSFKSNTGSSVVVVTSACMVFLTQMECLRNWLHNWKNLSTQCGEYLSRDKSLLRD
jgi:hypothetical protein